MLKVNYTTTCFRSLAMLTWYSAAD